LFQSARRNQMWPNTLLNSSVMGGARYIVQGKE